MKDFVRIPALAFLLRLARDIQFSRGQVALVIAAGLVAGLASSALIALVNHLLHGSAPAAWIVWSFVALCIVLPVTRFLSQIFLIRLTQQTTSDLRVHLTRRILSTPLGRLEALGPPRLLAILTNDVGTITRALANVPLLCLHAATIAGCLVYLGWLSWRGLIFVAAMIVIGAATYQIPVRRGLAFLRRARDLWDRIFEHLEASIEGVKELKLHRDRRREFVHELELTSRDYVRENVRGNAVYLAATSWGQMLLFAVIGLVLFLLPRFSDADTYVLTGYTLILLFILTPLQTVLNVFPTISHASVSVRKVDELALELADPAAAAVAERPPRQGFDTLELRGVTYGYPGDDGEPGFTLGPVDLRFGPGEVVFVTGGNGSGKTTLGKLLSGLYEPRDGEVWVDEQRLNPADREDLRELVSAVFHDTYLFGRLFGLKGADLDERAARYLAELQLAAKVQVEDGRLSTRDLSQGQRKRLALLTAYLEDRPVYLFDEWAADQDPVFKEVFYSEILAELRRRGKLVIVISHDDRYYAVADRVVKLENGRIHEVIAGPPAFSSGLAQGDGGLDVSRVPGG
jgi:putative ATP-binding cassette transporter